MDAKELQRKTKAQLVQLAREQGIGGARKMSKGQIIRAMQQPEAQPTAGDDAVATLPEFVEELDPGDLDKIQAASSDALEAILCDPELAGAKRDAVEFELLEREKARLRKEQESRRSDLAQFVVTKGPGRFIIPGHITQLPVGSLVSGLTYDLEEVRKQGFELAPCKGVRLTTDQMGFQRSEAIT